MIETTVSHYRMVGGIGGGGMGVVYKGEDSRLHIRTRRAVRVYEVDSGRDCSPG